MTSTSRFDVEGFDVLGQALTSSDVAALREVVAWFSAAVARNLLSNPTVLRLARSDALRSIYEPILGPESFPVRGLLFDKRPDSNWGVGWHQDTVIAVARRTSRSPLGFTAWSVKGGVPHVRPPAEVLERMLTLRIALDDADEENGALKVISGTHRRGQLEPDAVEALVASSRSIVCSCKAGDVVAMRPLLLHASTKSIENRRRRVIHLEYASEPLPPPLSWPRWRNRQESPVGDESPS